MKILIFKESDVRPPTFIIYENLNNKHHIIDLMESNYNLKFFKDVVNNKIEILYGKKARILDILKEYHRLIYHL